MDVHGWFDGACGPENPNGHAGYGALVKRNGVIIWEQAGYVGFGEGMTNNVAEYAGVIAIMKYLIQNKIAQSVIFGDSDLVIKQLDGKWKAKRGAYLPYYKEAIELRRKLPRMQLRWIPRYQNTDADYLSKQAINARRPEEQQREIAQLVEQQRRDRHDPRFIVVASSPTKGTPF